MTVREGTCIRRVVVDGNVCSDRRALRRCASSERPSKRRSRPLSERLARSDWNRSVGNWPSGDRRRDLAVGSAEVDSPNGFAWAALLRSRSCLSPDDDRERKREKVPSEKGVDSGSHSRSGTKTRTKERARENRSPFR